MQFTSHEYSTGQLRKQLNKLTEELSNAEHFIVLDSWYVVQYGVKILIFNKVSSQRWKLCLNRLKD
jgi:hypothetical protein